MGIASTLRRASRRPRPEPVPSASPVDEDGTILVIEDNDADVELLAAALVDAGVHLQIEAVHDGEHALDLAPETLAHSRLVVLDLNLPGISGFDVLAALRRRRALRGVPIVIMTSSQTPEDRELAASLGADDFVEKPATYDGYVAGALRLAEKYLRGTKTAG